jgi:hypothetical protein
MWHRQAYRPETREKVAQGVIYKWIGAQKTPLSMYNRDYFDE